MNPVSTSNAEHYTWGSDCDGWQESAVWPAREVDLHAGAGPREVDGGGCAGTSDQEVQAVRPAQQKRV